MLRNVILSSRKGALCLVPAHSNQHNFPPIPYLCQTNLCVSRPIEPVKDTHAEIP